jgi:hypothetical protein
MYQLHGLALQCYALGGEVSSRWCGAVLAEKERFLFPRVQFLYDVELIIIAHTPAGRMWQVLLPCLAPLALLIAQRRNTWKNTWKERAGQSSEIIGHIAGVDILVKGS